jgi:hypothetical protein
LNFEATIKISKLVMYWQKVIWGNNFKFNIQNLNYKFHVKIWIQNLKVEDYFFLKNEYRILIKNWFIKDEVDNQFIVELKFKNKEVKRRGGFKSKCKL